MLGDGGTRHPEGLGELPHGGRSPLEPVDDCPTGWVAQGRKHAVERIIGNHIVTNIPAPPPGAMDEARLSPGRRSVFREGLFEILPGEYWVRGGRRQVTLY